MRNELGQISWSLKYEMFEKLQVWMYYFVYIISNWNALFYVRFFLSKNKNLENWLKSIISLKSWHLDFFLLIIYVLYISRLKPVQTGALEQTL